MTLLDQLVYFYYHYDQFMFHKLSESDVRNTIGVLLDKGRILVATEDAQVLGYVESWRINYEQFGRILCREPFDIGLEDITRGNILYLANITVRPDLRKTTVLRELKRQFFEQNYDCDYFVGEANRKRTRPVKVLKLSEWRKMQHWKEAAHNE